MARTTQTLIKRTPWVRKMAHTQSYSLSSKP
nr:MAG TPA: hypothetical protein [Caudoviricetes sp.]